MEDPSIFETQLRTINTAASDARFHMILEHRALVQELKAVLTPDQQAKARRIRKNMRKEMEAHRALMEDSGEPDGHPEPLGPPS